MDDLNDALDNLAKNSRNAAGTRVLANNGGIAINASGDVTVLGGGGPGGPRRPFLIIGFGRVAGFFILLFFGGLMAYWVLPTWREIGAAGGGLPVALLQSLPSLGVLLASFLACTVAGFTAAGALYWALRRRPD